METGQWKIDLPALKAGGPYVMTVTGNNSVIFNNVMARRSVALFWTIEYGGACRINEWGGLVERCS